MENYPWHNLIYKLAALLKKETQISQFKSLYINIFYHYFSAFIVEKFEMLILKKKYLK